MFNDHPFIRTRQLQNDYRMFNAIFLKPSTVEWTINTLFWILSVLLTDVDGIINIIKIILCTVNLLIVKILYIGMR